MVVSSPGQRQTRWTHKKETEFLALLAEGNTVAHAASILRVGRATAYEHRAMDAAFAVAWDEAFEAGTEVLEQIAKQRATVGHKRDVILKDGTVITVQEQPSDTLLIFLLKGRKPDTYRDNVNVSGRVANDLSGLLAFARQAPDEPVARRPERILPASVEQDALDSPSGDSH